MTHKKEADEPILCAAFARPPSFYDAQMIKGLAAESIGTRRRTAGGRELF
jgi:hypothetical protein